MDNKDKLWYRSRGLVKLEARFGNKLIQKFLSKRLESEKEVRVLELGFGEGKVLLELRELFPKVKLFGVNDVKKGSMSKKSDFLKNAKKFGIKISNKNLPTPYFYDAGEGLKFEDNYFDAIVSQVAIPYVGNKAKLYEEFWRVLKPNGEAFLNVDSDVKDGMPDFMFVKNDTPRMVVYKGNKIVKTSNIFPKGYDISLSTQKNSKRAFILRMTKNTKKKLKLNLVYDGNSTIYLTKLKGSDSFKTDSGIWWGTRSVFRVK